MREEIIRKLQKLQAMAQGGTTHEAAAASRLMEALLSKYKIDLKEIETRALIETSAPANSKYASHLAVSLGLKAFVVGKRKKMYIEATAEEFDIFDRLWGQIKQTEKYQKKILTQKMKSYMAGFVSATFPVGDIKPQCPECKTEMNYGEDRWICPSCGYKARKARRAQYSYDDYMAGKNDSGRLITQTA